VADAKAAKGCATLTRKNESTKLMPVETNPGENLNPYQGCSGWFIRLRTGIRSKQGIWRDVVEL